MLLQSAVNAINDYFDYVKGTDAPGDGVEPSDAVLVYNNINPKAVRNLSLCFIACAFALGIYCICRAGLVPLIVALIGVLVIFLYSGGKTPISYLPIGELVSGFVMGGLITFASYTVLTQEVNALVLVWAIPLMCGIALTMFTNNGCDIEKDIQAGRRTLAVVIGRRRILPAYHALVYLWYAATAIVTAIWFTPGLLLLPFFILATYPLSRALLANPLTTETRIGAMAQVGALNVAMGSLFCLSIVLGGSAAIAL